MTRNDTETAGATRRRNVLMAAGAGSLTALAGCLGLGDDDDDDGTGEGGFGEAGQMTEDGVVTINFWPAWGGFYEDQLNQMIDEFESTHDDIEIDMNPLPDYRESRTAAFTNIDGGDPEGMPDITHFDTNETIVALDTGWFQPVEELLEDITPDDIIDPAAATSTFEGTLWAAPFYISNVVMHYNADMLEEAGHDPEDPPASLEGVREIGEDCVEEAGADYAVTIPNDSWFIESLVSEQNEFWLDNENGHQGEPTTVFATEDYSMDVVNWWADLADEELYFNGGIEDWTEPEGVFFDGRTPFNLNSSTSTDWVVSEDFEVRTAPLPTLGGEGIGHSRGAAEMWIVDKERSDQEREALREFVEFILSPEQQAFFHKESGYYPAHEGSWGILEDEGWFEENPRYQVLRDQLESWEEHDTNSGLLTGENPAITSELTAQMNEVFGGKDPEDAMADVKDEAEIALSRYQRDV